MIDLIHAVSTNFQSCHSHRQDNLDHIQHRRTTSWCNRIGLRGITLGTSLKEKL